MIPSFIYYFFSLKQLRVFHFKEEKVFKTLLFFSALLGGLTAFAGAQEANIIHFGIITDTHVCDKPDQSEVIAVNATPRFFTGSLEKLTVFAENMNKTKAAFAIELGDLTDNPADTSLTQEKRKQKALEFAKTAESRFALYKGPRYHVFGNHDTDQADKSDYLKVVSNTNIPQDQSYYSWDNSGIHFVVLDASYKADGSSYSGDPGAPGFGYSWDDANVPSAELEWLKKDLAAHVGPTIIFTHQLLNPQEIIDPLFDPHHTIRNAQEVRSILEKSKQVLAVFSGHYHDGGYQVVNGITYVVLQACVAYGNDLSYHNQYAIVDVYKEANHYKVVVAGHGLQKNYVINTIAP
jgi:predicted phosphodiesterase